MYGSLELANTFFAEIDYFETANDKWATYTEAQRTAALEYATKQIERLQFQGEKYIYTQSAQFPRKYYIQGQARYWDENINTSAIEIPVNVINATYYQAKYLLRKMNNSRMQAQQAGITSVSVGSTSESYDLAKIEFNANTQLTKQADDLIKPYLLEFY